MNYISVIELGSKSIKLVVGFCMDGKVHVIYTLKKDTPQCIEAGKVTDYDTLVKNIESICHIEDETARIKFHLSEVILCLPGYGFELRQYESPIGISNTEAVITDRDVFNAINAAKNSAKTANITPVDIVPIYFQLDDGSQYSTPPIGKAAHSMRAFLDVHTISNEIVSSLRNAVGAAGLRIIKFIVGPFAATELIGSYPDIPSEYFLVDIGSNITTVSLVGGKSISDCRFFRWGSDFITEKIIANFNINQSEAEKVKTTFGLYDHKLDFKVPVCITKDAEGNEIKHYNDELNTIVKGELEDFVKQLNASINDLLGEEYKSYNSIPMILVGGGSRLYGLKNYLEHKVMSNEIFVLNPTTIGARDPSFFNALGCIYTFNKYPLIASDTHANVGEVTRK